jgi:16S rRNA (guanine(527)-N(7))-methyltransferase RsmG
VNTPQKNDFIVAIQARIEAGEFNLTETQVKKAAQFAEILHRENEIQNLTRILGVEEFIDGHLVDVIELFKSNLLSSRVLDLGSGCGVPGLLAAAIDLDPNREWALCDSEKQKCEFLYATANEMGLENVSVYAGRVESFLQQIKPTTIISRAVGTVDKIAAWILNCSTWNNLVLFKSKGWEEEWKKAQLNKNGKKLTVSQKLEYSSKDKYRVLINLSKK